MHVCVFREGGREPQRHVFREKGGEIGVFTTIIVNAHPPIGMKRSLIKTESGRGEQRVRGFIAP